MCKVLKIVDLLGTQALVTLTLSGLSLAGNKMLYKSSAILRDTRCLRLLYDSVKHFWFIQGIGDDLQ
jgi:hypothetical protein